MTKLNKTTEEWKEIQKKRLETMRKRNSFYRPFGDKNPMRNPEIVRKVSLKNKGKKHSEEHKRRISTQSIN